MKSTLTLILLLVAGIASASHDLGGNISYKYAGSGVYNIYVTRYRDCNGVLMSATPVTVRFGNVQFNLSTTFSSKRDITPLAACQLSRCTGSSYPYGIEEHIFVAQLNTDTISSCEITLSNEMCCRTGSITTGSSSQNAFIYTILNKCYGGHNSPELRSTPLLLAQNNQNINYNLRAFDANSEFDSMAYSLVPVLQGYNSSAMYSGSFSAIRPLTFYGFPNQGLSYPAGFHFDALNGNLRFRPTQVGQTAPLGFLVKSYKKVSGTMQLVSSVQIEHTLFVVSSMSNKTQSHGTSTGPAAPQTYSICPDQEYCFTFQTYDQDTADSLVYFSALQNLPGLTVTSIGSNPQRPQYRICWTPDTNYTRNYPYFIYLTQNDSSCASAFYGQTILAYGFKVLKKPDVYLYPQVNKTPVCNGFIVQAFDIHSSGSSYSWKMGNQVYNSDSVRFTVADTGWHYYSLLIKQPGITCQAEIKDSFRISTIVGINTLMTIGNSLLCRGDTAKLSFSSSGGSGPYTYYRDNNLINNNYSFKTDSSNTILIYSADNNGCLTSDTFTLQINPAVYADTGPGDYWCHQRTDAYNLNGAGYGGSGTLQYTWINIGSGASLPFTPPANDSQVVLMVTDSVGCFAYDTLNIFRYNGPVANAGPDKKICGPGIVQLFAPGTYPVNTSFEWLNYGNGRTFPVYLTAPETIILMTEDSNGCKTYDSVEIGFNPSISINGGPDSAVCSGAPLQLNATVSGGTLPFKLLYWRINGNNYNSATVNTTLNSSTVAVAVVQDSLGCTAIDSVYITVFPGPVITVTPLGTALCTDNLPVSLVNNGSPTGGTWSGTGVSGSIFVPVAAGPGSHWLKYSKTSGSCTSKDSFQVEVRQKPSVQFKASPEWGKVPLSVFFENQTSGNHSVFWDFGYPGSGDTSSQDTVTYIYNSTGKYNVTLTVTDGVCFALLTKASYIDVKDSLNSFVRIQAEDVKVYPNPVNNELHIEWPIEHGSYILFDESGRSIQSGELKGKENTISTRELLPGAYVLQLVSDDRMIRVLLIRNR